MLPDESDGRRKRDKINVVTRRDGSVVCTGSLADWCLFSHERYRYAGQDDTEGGRDSKDRKFTS